MNVLKVLQTQKERKVKSGIYAPLKEMCLCL
jgi:hypothetical protein